MSEPHPPSFEQGDHDDDRSLLSQAWDIALYAPIGVLVEGPALLPKLARAGKARVRNARAAARMAVRQGETALRWRLADADNQLVDVLRLLGVVPTADETAEPSDSTPPTPSPDPAADGQAEGDGAESPDRESTGAMVTEADLTADDLAIPDYESLSAPQVVQRLSGLRHDELEAVRRYEMANRGRKTILNKVAQLVSRT